MHTSGHAVGSDGRTTKELQAPTDYSGIYQTWDVDLDEDIEADDPWDFGTSTQYPALVCWVTNTFTFALRLFAAGGVAPPPVGPTTARRTRLASDKNALPQRQSYL